MVDGGSHRPGTVSATRARGGRSSPVCRGYGASPTRCRGLAPPRERVGHSLDRRKLDSDAIEPHGPPHATPSLLIDPPTAQIHAAAVRGVRGGGVREATGSAAECRSGIGSLRRTCSDRPPCRATSLRAIAASGNPPPRTATVRPVGNRGQSCRPGRREDASSVSRGREATHRALRAIGRTFRRRVTPQCSESPRPRDCQWRSTSAHPPDGAAHPRRNRS